MYELVQKLTVYQGDEYIHAFKEPILEDSCHRLRTDKWNICHPTGDPKVSHPSCALDMDEEELVDLYNAHMTCRNYRAMENSSKCFSSVDKGHKIAQRIQLTEANRCLDLLNKKMEQQPKKLTRKQQEQKRLELEKKEEWIRREREIQEQEQKKEQDALYELQYKKEQEETEEPLDEIDFIQEPPKKREKKKKQTIWKTLGFYVLFFFSIFLILMFIYYIY